MEEEKGELPNMFMLKVQLFKLDGSIPVAKPQRPGTTLRALTGEVSDPDYLCITTHKGTF